ncbi:metallophosphoesterase [Pseudovibrio sp. FO-BEG1]|uniref:metallophosphoesterase n=1 Tax=Pseudovibrio sp. (strain FO-BEG1) TaxID=911045 RepID=UPI0011D1BDAF|nr:metallophosphoesterase [Pseudovibrio sp. FO-BEG1]
MGGGAQTVTSANMSQNKVFCVAFGLNSRFEYAMLVAQISDIHANPNNNNLQRLNAVIAWLEVVQPDVLIVSGDLVDDRWADGYGLILDALAPLSGRRFVLPGNADDRHLMRECLPKEDYWHHPYEMHFAESVGGVTFVGVDTCLDGETEGSVPEHLSWLEQTLDRCETGTAFLFTHQHLFPSGIEPADKFICQGTDQLESMLKSCSNPPVAMSSGHVHRSMSSMIAGVPAYICGSVCLANPLLLDVSWQLPSEQLPALMLHDFRSGRLVSSHVSVDGLNALSSQSRHLVSA